MLALLPDAGPSIKKLGCLALPMCGYLRSGLDLGHWVFIAIIVVIIRRVLIPPFPALSWVVPVHCIRLILKQIIVPAFRIHIHTGMLSLPCC